MSKNKVRLHATQGASEANHSSSPVPYPVDINGDVMVDEEAVAPLLEKGGFVLAEPPAPVEVAEGHVRVVHKHDPNATCSAAVGGAQRGADGSILVPVESVSHLLAHGFEPVAEVVTPTLKPAEDPRPSTDKMPDSAKAEPEMKPEPAKAEPEKKTEPVKKNPEDSAASP